MSLRVADIQGRLTPHFAEIEQIDETVLRCTKQSQGRPYAIYYFDAASELPASVEALHSYQDRVIGTRYFDGDKSLQWNNYLYFLVDEDVFSQEATQRAKAFIEGDRTYARKCVIRPADLPAFLEPPTFSKVIGRPQPNVYSTWIKKLAEAQIDAAILSSDNLPARLALIENGEAALGESSTSITSRVPDESFPFLHSLMLERYRPYPTDRLLEFGDVNLVCGVNGTGKTSLLEAIELAYCGRTKRNPQSGEKYQFRVTYSDGEIEQLDNRRTLQVFRDRNLAWYGQAEVRSNNLCNSFGRFNFLDTDAAVKMSETTSDIQEYLAKLLVGADASTVWNHINRVNDKLAGKIRETEPLFNELTVQLGSVTRLLGQPVEANVESDAIWAQLVSMAQRIKWSPSDDPKSQQAASLASSLSEALSVFEQATALDWATTPATLSSLQADVEALAKRQQSSQEGFDRLITLAKEERELGTEATRLKEFARSISEAERLLAAGVPQLVDRIDRLRSEIQESRPTVAGRPAIDQDSLQSSNDTPLDDALSIALESLQESERRRDEARQSYDSFAAQREKATNLAQQLRDIAAQLIPASESPDECPLCHTQFDEGQLSKHIGHGIDDTLEQQAQQLLSRLRAAENEAKAAVTTIENLQWLHGFCGRKQLATTATVAKVLAEAKRVDQAIADGERRLTALQNELSSFEEQGLGAARLQEIPQALSDAGYSWRGWDKDDIAILESSISTQVTNTGKELEARQNSTHELRYSLGKALDVADPEIAQLQKTLASQSQRINTARAILSELEAINTRFSWEANRPLAEFSVLGGSIRKVAADYQSATVREQEALTAKSEAVKRKVELEEKLKVLKPIRTRLNHAKEVLQDIVDNHSLTDAMKEALEQNREGIESVFSRIHCPAEFSKVGGDLKSLVRKDGNGEASLSQISTGQRAAFALSIFLAQNGQIKTAPPVVLIDDPIAHVDDLNSLSFLDYLREVALAGKRQLFFATADEKLAALFERKFSFLGDRFRRFTLSRLV